MVSGVSSCHYPAVPQSISFSGSGFMATYQLGVAQCLRDFAPWLLRTAPRILGSSAGSLVAAAVVCEISPIVIRDEMLHFAKQLKAFTLGPFNPSVNVFHWLKYVVHKHLPSDAHRLASGRLAVAMTRLTDGKHIVMSEFQSKEDVEQALLCSCFVPGYCGMHPPSFKGVYYMDGGFTSFQPILPTHTLTVSPFSGEIDICPIDRPCIWDLVVSGTTLKGNVANSFRIINALYPITLETLEQAYHSGYSDALTFLFRNDLAPCLTIQELSKGPLKCNETKRWLQLDTSADDKDEMKAQGETGVLTSFLDYSCTQRLNCNEPQHTRNERPEESTLCFDMVKNALLDNGVSYVSMSGLPARILSYLLLPLMLLFYTVLQGRPSLELLILQALELVVWVWQSLRQFNFFVFSIFLYSLKKNMKDRVILIILFVKWLKILAQHEEAPKILNKLQ